jgi:TfoX/Sxy family transcriptional regulator of competence genes
MPFDEKLADRVRRALAGERGLAEKKMFGGVAFMLHGNMCCGVLRDDLVVRVGPDAHAAQLKRPHARVMDFTHRPMKGYLYVAPKGTATTAALRSRLAPALAFVATLPKK